MSILHWTTDKIRSWASHWPCRVRSGELPIACKARARAAGPRRIWMSLRSALQHSVQVIDWGSVLGEGISHVGSQIRKPSAVGSTRAPWGRMLGRSSVDSSAVAKYCMVMRIVSQPVWTQGRPLGSLFAHLGLRSLKTAGKLCVVASAMLLAMLHA